MLVVRVVLSVLMLRRVGADLTRVWRRELPATRLTLPLALLVGLLLVANHAVPRIIAAAGLVVLDVLVLVLCIGLVASLKSTTAQTLFTEKRLQHEFERFFPTAVARLASVELTVARHIARGVRAFINPPRADAATYVGSSKVALLAVVLSIAVVPDALLLWMVIPHRLWRLDIALNVLDVWACAWAFGLYGTMVARPHELGSERIVFHNGVLGRAEVVRGEIADATALGVVRRRALPRRRGDGSQVLAFGGVPIVNVRLRDGRSIFVASDVPHQLCSALVASDA